MAGSGLCCLSLVYLAKLTKFTFIPQDDSSEFEISLQTPEGTDLESTAELCDQIEQRLKSLQINGQTVIADTLTTIGITTGRLGKGEGDVRVATIYCRLPTLGGVWWKLLGTTRRWSQFQAMVMARQIMAQFPDVRSAAQLISNIGVTGRNSDLIFNLVGPDLEKLTGYSEEMISRLRATPGLVDVDSTLANRKP